MINLSDQFSNLNLTEVIVVCELQEHIFSLTQSSLPSTVQYISKSIFADSSGRISQLISNIFNAIKIRPSSTSLYAHLIKELISIQSPDNKFSLIPAKLLDPFPSVTYPSFDRFAFLNECLKLKIIPLEPLIKIIKTNYEKHPHTFLPWKYSLVWYMPLILQFDSKLFQSMFLELKESICGIKNTLPIKNVSEPDSSDTEDINQSTQIIHKQSNPPNQPNLHSKSYETVNNPFPKEENESPAKIDTNIPANLDTHHGNIPVMPNVKPIPNSNSIQGISQKDKQSELHMQHPNHVTGTHDDNSYYNVNKSKSYTILNPISTTYPNDDNDEEFKKQFNNPTRELADFMESVNYLKADDWKLYNTMVSNTYVPESLPAILKEDRAHDLAKMIDRYNKQEKKRIREIELKHIETMEYEYEYEYEEEEEDVEEEDRNDKNKAKKGKKVLVKFSDNNDDYEYDSSYSENESSPDLRKGIMSQKDEKSDPENYSIRFQNSSDSNERINTLRNSFITAKEARNQEKAQQINENSNEEGNLPLVSPNNEQENAENNAETQEKTKTNYNVENSFNSAQTQENAETNRSLNTPQEQARISTSNSADSPVKNAINQGALKINKNAESSVINIMESRNVIAMKNLENIKNNVISIQSSTSTTDGTTESSVSNLGESQEQSSAIDITGNEVNSNHPSQTNARIANSVINIMDSQTCASAFPGHQVQTESESSMIPSTESSQSVIQSSSILSRMIKSKSMTNEAVVLHIESNTENQTQNQENAITSNNAESLINSTQDQENTKSSNNAESLINSTQDQENANTEKVDNSPQTQENAEPNGSISTSQAQASTSTNNNADDILKNIINQGALRINKNAGSSVINIMESRNVIAMQNHENNNNSVASTQSSTSTTDNFEDITNIAQAQENAVDSNAETAANSSIPQAQENAEINGSLNTPQEQARISTSNSADSPVKNTINQGALKINKNAESSVINIMESRNVIAMKNLENIKNNVISIQSSTSTTDGTTESSVSNLGESQEQSSAIDITGNEVNSNHPSQTNARIANSVINIMDSQACVSAFSGRRVQTESESSMIPSTESSQSVIQSSSVLSRMIKSRSKASEVSNSSHKGKRKVKRLKNRQEIPKFVPFNLNQRIISTVFEKNNFLRNGPTLIQFASFYGSVLCVIELVKRGADLAIQDLSHKSTAMFAIAGGDMKIIEIFEYAKIDFSATPQIAAFFMREEAFKRLMETERFKLDQVDINYASVLHQAAASNNIRSMIYCIEHGVDVNIKNVKNMTPLHFAALNGQMDAVMLLSAHKNIDINAKAVDGTTPLMMAAKSGFASIVGTLLSNPNINVNEVDSKGSTAAHLAALSNYVEVIKLLVEHKEINLSIKDSNQRTAADLANLNGFHECAQIIADHMKSECFVA